MGMWGYSSSRFLTSVSQPIKKLPAFYVTRRFIIMFTTAPQLIPILSEINSLHALPFYFFKIPFNIILPHTPRSSKWSLSLRFLHQNSVCISLFPHTCHITHSSSLITHSNSIWSAVQIVKPLIMQFHPVSCYFLPLSPKYLRRRQILVYIIANNFTCSA